MLHNEKSCRTKPNPDAGTKVGCLLTEPHIHLPTMKKSHVAFGPVVRGLRVGCQDTMRQLKDVDNGKTNSRSLCFALNEEV